MLFFLCKLKPWKNHIHIHIHPNHQGIPPPRPPDTIPAPEFQLAPKSLLGLQKARWFFFFTFRPGKGLAILRVCDLFWGWWVSSRDPLERLFFWPTKLGITRSLWITWGRIFCLYTFFCVSEWDFFWCWKTLLQTHTLGKNQRLLCRDWVPRLGGDFLAIFGGWVRYFSKCVSGQKRMHQGYDMKKEISKYTPEDKHGN